MKRFLKILTFSFPIVFTGCSFFPLRVDKVDLDALAPSAPKCVTCLRPGTKFGLSVNVRKPDDLVGTTTEYQNTLDVPVSKDTAGDFLLHEEIGSGALFFNRFTEEGLMNYGLLQLSAIGGNPVGFASVGGGKVFRGENDALAFYGGISGMNYLIRYQYTEFAYFNTDTAGVPQRRSHAGLKFSPTVGFFLNHRFQGGAFLSLSAGFFHFTDFSFYGQKDYHSLGINHTFFPIGAYFSPGSDSKLRQIYGVEVSPNTVAGPTFKFTAGVEI